MFARVLYQVPSSRMQHIPSLVGNSGQAPALRMPATQISLGEPFPCVYLLVKAAVDGAPADLHESLGGDEHLVDPLP